MTPLRLLLLLTSKSEGGVCQEWCGVPVPAHLQILSLVMFNLISLFWKGKDGFSVLEVERPWLLSVESDFCMPPNQLVFATGDGFPFSALNVTAGGGCHL